jgi:hypothetical protein
MYREIFSKHFPSPAAASTVPHVSISHAARLNIEIPMKGILFSTCQLGEEAGRQDFSPARLFQL